MAFGGDEDIAFQGAALGGVRHDEAVAVAMHAEAAGDEVLAGGGVLGQGVTVAAGLDEATALDQRFEALGKLLTLFTPQAHLAHELFVSGRVVWLAFDVA